MRSWPLLPEVTLDVPVVQAPLGRYDGPRLAAEVSRAGGLGSLSITDPSPEIARRRLRRVRERTPRPILVALTGQWDPDSVLDACIAEDFRLFQVFWWNGPRVCGRIRRAGGRVFWQVGTPEEAGEAAEMGADVLVAQGTGAGGQVRGPVPLRELLPAVIEATALPVIGCGGLGDRADVRDVLTLGARAAMLGTRFVASEESRAPARDKARIVRAGACDLVLDTRHIGEWPCAPCRILPNGLDGADMECGPQEEKPRCYAGVGVGRIHRIAPAAEIVRALDPGEDDQ